MFSQEKGWYSGLWIIAVASAWRVVACPIPVYQYALEHWPSDEYRVVVRVGEAMDDDQRQALAQLRGVNRPGGRRANLTVEEQPAEADDASSMVLHYPAVHRIRRPVWSGELSTHNVQALLTSPARNRLGDLLVHRVSAVWVLLESGDRRADDAVERLLRNRLERLEKTLVVPSSADWGGTTVHIDHRVNFDLLRISRDDPEEELFVHMLLGLEADLEGEFAGECMVFPVYGRGLVLYALVGRGIHEWTLDEAAEFLAGPCSCQVKASNPGTDLLLEVDWPRRVTATTPAAVSTTVGTGAFLQRLDAAAEALP